MKKMKKATPARLRMDLRIHAVVFVSSMMLWGVGLLSHWLAVQWHLDRDGGADRSG